MSEFNFSTKFDLQSETGDHSDTPEERLKKSDTVLILKSTKWTKRQKSRITLIPWMALFPILAIILEVIFETVCADAVDITQKINMIRGSIYCIQGCTWLIIIFAAIAFGGVLCPRKPIIPLALNFGSAILLLFFITMFAGWHYYSETSKISESNGLLKFSKKARNDDNFHRREFVWLEKTQLKLNCCGFRGYTQYDQNAKNTLNENDWLHTEKFLKQDEDVPKTCCKSQHSNDTTCGNGVFSNSSKINEIGCQTLVYNTLSDCQMIFWVMVFLPLIIGIPMTTISYIFTRNAQGVSCTKGFCSNPAMVKDPELDADETIKSRKSNEKMSLPSVVDSAVTWTNSMASSSQNFNSSSMGDPESKITIEGPVLDSAVVKDSGPSRGTSTIPKPEGNQDHQNSTTVSTTKDLNSGSTGQAQKRVHIESENKPKAKTN